MIIFVLYKKTNMNYNLFLDDERWPKQKYVEDQHKETFGKTIYEWLVVRNYKDFCEAIDIYGIPEYLSLDHDLGEDSTGFNCVVYLINYCLDNELQLTSKVCYHSANPIGVENMKGLITSFIKHN